MPSFRDFLSDSSHVTAEIFQAAVKDRRALHLFPELGFELPKTRAYLEAALAEIGFHIDPVAYGVSGLVAWLDGAQEGPVTLLRADMDALPIREIEGRSWRSEVEGCSHACGHDAHMAIALGVARIAVANRDSLIGRIVLCLQPSEEPGGGARAMIDDGVLAAYKPDACFGVHVWTELDTGVIAAREGALFASCDKLSWRIKGNGGHGAIPHLTRDTVGALADVIQTNSALVAREVNAQEAAVISIGSISAGSAHNVVPELVECMGTLRTQSVASREFILDRLQNAADGIGRKFGVEIEFAASGYIPPCVGHAEKVRMVLDSVTDNLSNKCSVNLEYATMAGEDMAEFLIRVPGCYFLVGCRNVEKGIYAPHHTSDFDIDEDALAIAISVLAGIVLRGAAESRVSLDPAEKSQEVHFVREDVTAS